MSDKDNVPKKRGRGRPRKTEVEAKKKRGVVGRPPGEAARIKEFHARLLATSGETVINTIITKALDNDDKDQVACLKMCIDRVLPMSYFDKGKDAGRGSVNIQISMVGDKKAEVLEQEEPQDIEYETVDVRPED
ncbi:MAG: hypothetical protein CMJ25_07770 [Phycisphaerae bacterium]|nr:hypothetical protein [Phycisphaerae bacterium]